MIIVPPSSSGSSGCPLGAMSNASWCTPCPLSEPSPRRHPRFGLVIDICMHHKSADQNKHLNKHLTDHALSRTSPITHTHITHRCRLVYSSTLHAIPRPEATKRSPPSPEANSPSAAQDTGQLRHPASDVCGVQRSLCRMTNVDKHLFTDARQPSPCVAEVRRIISKRC